MSYGQFACVIIGAGPHRSQWTRSWSSEDPPPLNTCLRMFDKLISPLSWSHPLSGWKWYFCWPGGQAWLTITITLSHVTCSRAIIGNITFSMHSLHSIININACVTVINLFNNVRKVSVRSIGSQQSLVLDPFCQCPCCNYDWHCSVSPTPAWSPPDITPCHQEGRTPTPKIIIFKKKLKWGHILSRIPQLITKWCLNIWDEMKRRY